MRDSENKNPEAVAQHEDDEVAKQAAHSKRRLMELAIAATTALAVICGVFVTVFAYYHQHSLIIWATYLAVIFAILVPFLYWQKRENERQSRAGFSDPLPIAPSPAPPPSVSPTALPRASKSISSTTPKPPKIDGGSPSSKPKMGYGSGAPPAAIRRPHYADLTQPKWTDYTEDYFYGAIWRWKYRPEMGDNEPRDICIFCPECDWQLRKIGGTGKVDPDKGRTVSFQCSQHVRLYHFQSPSYDDFDGIRALILERLENGQWKEVVKLHMDVRAGRI